MHESSIRMRPMTVFGGLSVAGTVLFAGRIIYEQTFLTWHRGLQMVGFSLFHSGIGLLGILSVLTAIFWTLVVVTRAVARRERVSRTNCALIAVLVVCCGGLTVPYGQWKLLMARTFGAANVPSNWVTYAAATGEKNLLAYLLANGFDVNSRDENGQSPLGAAAVEGRVDVARMLLDSGAHVENRTVSLGETPLTQAAQMNHADMVKLLLDHGAAADERDATGRTALDWAKKNGNSEMSALLQAH
jgi:hypothetical protein